MTGKKKRTIKYLVAKLFTGVEVSLQEAVQMCLKQFPTVAETCIRLEGMRVEIRHNLEQGEGLFLHICGYTAKEPASIVPHAVSSDKQADLSSRLPGNKWDYLDGDGMIFLRNNNVLIVTSGLAQGLLERYIKALLRQTRASDKSLPEHIELFGLEPIAASQEDIRNEIELHGIKKLDLNIGSYWETERRRRDRNQTRMQSIMQSIGLDILNSLVTKDEDRKAIAEADNVNARLVISIDGRKMGIKPEKLKLCTKQLVTESPDEVEFVTGGGKIYKRGDLIEKKEIEVAKAAKTVDYKDAWDHMDSYWSELKDTMDP